MSYQGRGALQITEEEQQCAKCLILASCTKLFTHCEVGKEGVELVLAHLSGMTQMVKAQIAPHPKHVASDGEFCITPHQHFFAIALQQPWYTDVGSKQTSWLGIRPA